jgi:hypothetical protein
MTRATSLATLALAALSCLASVTPSHAGGPFLRRARAVVPTAAVENPADANANAPSPMLGTFYPTPYVMVGGDRPTGSGYSPLGQYGVVSTAMYGPMSIYRTVTAPVSVYTRGYDGSVREVRGHSFSSPNLPESNPVVYPTPAAYRDRLWRGQTPPWWTRGEGWIDQN